MVAPHARTIGTAKFPVSRGKACHSAQVDYIRFTSRLRKVYFWMTKVLGRKLLQPEEAVARLRKDHACRACRGYKSKTNRCQRIVQCRCMLNVRRAPPIEFKISQGFPFSPWLDTATVSQAWFKGRSHRYPGFPLLEFSLLGHRSGKLVSL
jgi:hypothetical protein